MNAREAYDGRNRGEQAIDSRPGFYYVTAIRSDGAVAYLFGPVATHEAALAFVGVSREAACKVDDRAWWYAYGTGRSDADLGPGKLNSEVARQCAR